MDLKTFVAETLKEIVAGVVEAQAADGGDAINAELNHGGTLPGRLMRTYYGTFTCVDFDVAVSAEGTVGGKGGLHGVRRWAQG